MSTVMIPNATYEKKTFTFHDEKFQKNLEKNDVEKIDFILTKLGLKVKDEDKQKKIERIEKHVDTYFKKPVVIKTKKNSILLPDPKPDDECITYQEKGTRVKKSTPAGLRVLKKRAHELNPAEYNNVLPNKFEIVVNICNAFIEHKGLDDDDIREVLHNVQGLPAGLKWTKKLSKPKKITGMKLFKDENFDEFKSENPGATNKDVMKHLSDAWKELDKSEKKSWAKRASEMNEGFEEKLEKYYQENPDKRPSETTKQKKADKPKKSKKSKKEESKDNEETEKKAETVKQTKPKRQPKKSKKSEKEESSDDDGSDNEEVETVKQTKPKRQPKKSKKSEKEESSDDDSSDNEEETEKKVEKPKRQPKKSKKSEKEESSDDDSSDSEDDSSESEETEKKVETVKQTKSKNNDNSDSEDDNSDNEETEKKVEKQTQPNDEDSDDESSDSDEDDIPEINVGYKPGNSIYDSL